MFCNALFAYLICSDLEEASQSFWSGGYFKCARSGACLTFGMQYFSDRHDGEAIRTKMNQVVLVCACEGNQPSRPNQMFLRSVCVCSGNPCVVAIEIWLCEFEVFVGVCLKLHCLRV